MSYEIYMPPVGLSMKMQKISVFDLDTAQHHLHNKDDVGLIKKSVLTKSIYLPAIAPGNLVIEEISTSGVNGKCSGVRCSLFNQIDLNP